MERYQIKEIPVSMAGEIYESFIEPYFPDDEKKPLKSIIAMMEENHYRIFCLEEKDNICAAAFLATRPGGNMYLLDYLAVDEGIQSKGYGSILLKECVLLTNNQPILIETECIEASQSEEERMERMRRNSFYKRNGVHNTTVKTSCFGVVFDIWVLSNGEVPEDEKIISELTGIYHYFVPNPDVYERKVYIPYDR